MSVRGETPLVSVVTPVYNMGDFLATCIESVLSQTYETFEYIISDNCSTDRTLEIARQYASRDPRVKVYTNKRFVGVIENHNIAFGLISPEAEYCKVVSADDFLFPECLVKMVELAEANPSVSIVGSYSLAGKKVIYGGLEYEKAVVNGRELCRATLLGGPYVFGSPTSLLYRAHVVRKTKTFYPNSSPHSDTTACYESLAERDFGFVHQVLSYTRIHAASQTSRSIKYGIIKLAVLSDFCRFGPDYLNQLEMNKRLTLLVKEYYESVLPTLFEQLRNRKFWQEQKAQFQAMGLQFSNATLMSVAFLKASRWLLRPRAAIKRISQNWRTRGRIEAQYYEGNVGT